MNDLLPREARPHLPAYGALAFLVAAMRAAAALLIVPLLAALFSDGPSAALGWFGALALASVIGWVAETRLIRRAFDIGIAVAIAANNRLVDRLLGAPFGWLTTQRQDEAKRALAGSVPELFAAFINLGGQISIAVATPLLIGIGLLFVSWPLGVVALIATPSLYGALLLGARLMRRAEADFAAASLTAAMRTDEFARAQIVLRASGRTDVDGSPLGKAIEAQRRTGFRFLMFTLPGTLVYSLVLQGALVAMLVLIGLMFADGGLPAAQTVALIAVVLRFIEPFNALSDLFPALESARGAWKRTSDVLNAPQLTRPSQDAAPGAMSVNFADAGLVLEGRTILSGVSFDVPPGTTTAIVGPSGGGKSTILSLIARFHDVTSGAVRVAGHDVRAYAPETLMDQMAIVFQNVQLFEGSIEANIRIARPDASEAEVRAAAQAAGVSEIVDRLGGWSAPVGEGGGALSGGERQRISIARALLKDAPILLLDEATSALDTGNEAAIATALRGFGGRTILIVAHRLETIAHADTIIFVDGGRIVEAGPRDALLAQNGRFAAYWQQRRAARDWQLDTHAENAPA